MFPVQSLFELTVLLRFLECHLHSLLYEGSEVTLLVTDNFGVTQKRTIGFEVVKGLLQFSQEFREEIDSQQINKLIRLLEEDD